jgi:hypothetical protein
MTTFERTWRVVGVDTRRKPGLAGDGRMGPAVSEDSTGLAASVTFSIRSLSGRRRVIVLPCLIYACWFKADVVLHPVESIPWRTRTCNLQVDAAYGVKYANQPADL